jgi:hypothetical protein
MNLFRKIWELSGAKPFQPRLARPFSQDWQDKTRLGGSSVEKAADHKYPMMERQWALFSIVGGSIQPM